jgi:RNA polymerase sigma-70 factor (ECF subfamily)
LRWQFTLKTLLWLMALVAAGHGHGASLVGASRVDRSRALNFLPLDDVLLLNGRAGQMSDEDLLRTELLVIRCQRGDRSAFTSIVELWERPLFYYLRRLAPSEAATWDILQETWLRAFRSMRTLRDPRTLPAFLYRTARNAALDHLRYQHREEPLDNRPDDRAASWNHVAAFDNADDVHHALDLLPIGQREALALYFLEDLSLDEIAMLLGVPVGTVKSRLHYGKLAIRKILEGDDNVNERTRFSQTTPGRTGHESGAARR